MSSADSVLKEISQRPYVDLALLKPGQTVLVEAAGSLYEIRIVNKELVAVYGTGQIVPPILTGYRGAWLTRDRGLEIKNRIIKGMRMAFYLADGTYVSEMVDSASVHGKGWHYDAI